MYFENNLKVLFGGSAVDRPAHSSAKCWYRERVEVIASLEVYSVSCRLGPGSLRSTGALGPGEAGPAGRWPGGLGGGLGEMSMIPGVWMLSHHGNGI